jgi:hypothetical protein
MLELLHREFKTIVINMLMTPKEKVEEHAKTDE